MNVHEVKAVVKDAPYMSVKQAERMTGFIREHRLKDVLELGFYHGVSSCYFAAAVEPLGGRLTTIDLASAGKRSPNITELLEACGLTDLVDVYFEPQSFTWRLMRMLEDGKGPRFDLVYLDGGHTWDVTGFAFFLVDRLLRPGGWLIFDDIDWSFANSNALQDNARLKKMPADYLETPQVRKVFELLVQQHPSYTDCRVDNRWGYARKKDSRKKDSRAMRGLARNIKRWALTRTR